MTVPLKKKWSKTSLASLTSPIVDYTASEDTKKPSKTLAKKPEKCFNCDNEVDEKSNRYLCNECFEEFCDSKICNKLNCKYKATYNGFCGHHISTPKPENYIKPNYDTSRKILLKPTLEQRQILLQWFGVARKCYNNANNHLRKKTVSLNDIRDTVIKNLDQEFPYVKSVPLKIKQEAISDLKKATTNAINKYKKTKKFQKIHFQKRKAPSQSININKEAIKPSELGVCIYPTLLGEIVTKESINKIPTHCRITLKYGRFFYLCIPKTLKKIEIKPVLKDSIVAIDPGERIFSSFYSPVLEGQIGIKCRDRLGICFKESDKIKSKMGKEKIKIKKLKGRPRKNAKNKQKRRKRKFLSVISKPTRLAQELHYKTALFLCKNFHTILIPEYSSKDTAKNLCEIVNRSNQGLSHYSFRERLKHTAKRYNRKVHIVPESYTTMTCTDCGYLNEKYTNEYLTCSNCNLEIHRDKRGSRNIYIKNVLWFKDNI
jgi:transposase